MGRKERRKATQILCAGNPAISNSRASPVTGSGGKRSYGHEAPVGRVPGDPQGELARRAMRRWPGPLVSFPSLGKKPAARRAALSAEIAAKSPLRTTTPIQNLPPHPPQCEHWGTFPPGGKAKKEQAAKRPEKRRSPIRGQGSVQQIILRSTGAPGRR